MMRKYSPLVFLCITCLWVTSLCGYSQATVPPDRHKRTVVDMSGRTVEIPRVVNRIVITCYGGAGHEIAVLGGADKIVAHPSKWRFPQLQKMYPLFDTLSDAGSFDIVDIERIMVLKPDIVVASVYSVRGNKKIESAGFPVVAVSTGRADIDRLLQEFKMMGKILDKEKAADELVQYWNDRLAMIRKRTDAIPEAKRKKVFYASSGISLTTTTESESGWGHHFITEGGGINVSKNLQIEGGAVSPEQLLIWDPHVIVTRGDRDHRDPVRAIRSTPRFTGIKAVKENAVYCCPVGAFWWDRPSPEAILGIMWLAKTLYPKAMSDIDIKKETKWFFERFYKYSLTDKEYESFGVGINPKGAGRESNR